MKYFITIIQSVNKENYKVVNNIKTRDSPYRWQKSLPSIRMRGIFDAQLTRNFLAFFLHSHRANGPSFLHEGDPGHLSSFKLIPFIPWNRTIPLGFHLNGDDSRKETAVSSQIQRFWTTLITLSIQHGNNLIYLNNFGK